MSYLLAIESSTKPLSVALFKDEQLIEEVQNEPGVKTHSENLLPFINNILKKQNLVLSDVISIAVAAGPGAFTSLRVGMATVIGLAIGSQCSIYPVSSLKALALGVTGDDSIIVPVFKSGRGRVYAAAFITQDGNLKERVSEGVYLPKDFLGLIQGCTQKVHFVGAGFELLNLKESEVENYSYFKGIQPKAALVGRLNYQEKNKPLTANEVRLRYLQEPDIGGKKVTILL